jgi:hypothetical protein
MRSRMFDVETHEKKIGPQYWSSHWQDLRDNKEATNERVVCVGEINFLKTEVMNAIFPMRESLVLDFKGAKQDQLTQMAMKFLMNNDVVENIVLLNCFEFDMSATMDTICKRPKLRRLEICIPTAWTNKAHSNVLGQIAKAIKDMRVRSASSPLKHFTTLAFNIAPRYTRDSSVKHFEDVLTNGGFSSFEIESPYHHQDMTLIGYLLAYAAAGNVKSVTLMGFNISRPGNLWFAEMSSQFQEIYLYGCTGDGDFGREFLAHCADSPKLQVLDVYGYEMTEENSVNPELANVARSSKSLRVLRYRGSHLSSEEAADIAAAAQANPNNNLSILDLEDSSEHFSHADFASRAHNFLDKLREHLVEIMQFISEGGTVLRGAIPDALKAHCSGWRTRTTKAGGMDVTGIMTDLLRSPYLSLQKLRAMYTLANGGPSLCRYEMFSEELILRFAVPFFKGENDKVPNAILARFERGEWFSKEEFENGARDMLTKERKGILDTQSSLASFRALRGGDNLRSSESMQRFFNSDGNGDLTGIIGRYLGLDAKLTRLLR